MFCLGGLEESLDIKSKVLSGLKWSALSKLLVQLFSWTSTFLVIRILTPEDYGLIAITSVFFTFITIFTVNGFVTSLVRAQELDKKVCSQLFTLSLALYITIGLVISLFAQQISVFYQNLQIENVIYAMAVITPLNSFCIIPNAYLNIAMNFKAKAICESTSALVAAAVALYFAYSGAGYWALVYSFTAELFIRTLLLNCVNKNKYNLAFGFDSLKAVLSFSYKIQLNELIWFSYNKLDTIIVGKVLGIQQLGIYNVGVEIASMPMTKASAILNQVGFSAFSKVNDDLAASKYYLGRSIKLLSLIVFPIFLGISAVANEVIVIFVGEKWLEAATIITIFAFVFPFRMINAVIYNFVIAMNEPRFAIENTVMICFTVIVALCIGVQFGIVYTALAWVIGFMIAFLLVLIRVRKKFSTELSVVYCWSPSFFVSLFMWFILFVLNMELYKYNVSVFVILMAKILVGASYIGLFYMIFHKDELKSVLNK